MIVRLATSDDMDEIVRGAHAFAEQANVEHLVAKNIEVPLSTLIDLPMVRIYLAETDAVVGGIGVGVAPFIWNPELTEMCELFFWVYPDAPATAALALLRRVMADAEDELIDLMTFVSLPTSPEGVGRLYERLGFTKLQETYLKELFSWR